ncbi:MAG: PorP/SprF family type IX secretion system membrane protein [Adhaeribacter sp.]
MKKYSFLLLFTFAVLGLQAQNRKQVAQFSLFQPYFNPAMTGMEGSQLKTFYRDQFTGFEGGPQTFLLSGELNLADLKAQAAEAGAAVPGLLAAKNAVGFSMLRDNFGPFKETQFNLGYGSQVRLSEKLSLRAGAALTYHVSRLDPNKMTVDQENDSEFQNLYGTDNNQTHKLDVNAGLTLAGQDFYLGYGIQDLAKGQLLTGDHYYDQTFPLHHVVQGGYRRGLTDQFGLVFNGIYRYDSKLQETLEGQLKGVWNDSYWVGVGYRHDLALTFCAGLRVQRLRLGYAREVVTGKADGINAATNELILTYHLRPLPLEKIGRTLSLW